MWSTPSHNLKKVNAKARSNVKTLKKSKRNEVARINMVQAKDEEMYFMFYLEYRNAALWKGISYALPTKSQCSHSLKTQVRWVKHNGLIYSTSHQTLEKLYVSVSKPECLVWPVMAIFQKSEVPIPKSDVLISTG
jgi:hypothetical protein